MQTLQTPWKFEAATQWRTQKCDQGTNVRFGENIFYVRPDLLRLLRTFFFYCFLFHFQSGPAARPLKYAPAAASSRWGISYRPSFEKNTLVNLAMLTRQNVRAASNAATKSVKQKLSEKCFRTFDV